MEVAFFNSLNNLNMKKNYILILLITSLFGWAQPSDAIQPYFATPIVVSNPGNLVRVGAAPDYYWEVLSFNDILFPFSQVSGKPTTLAGYGITNAYPLTGNPSGFLTGINSSQVTSALGFTPYNSTNPSGFISSITSSMVNSALGYTPYNGTTNPSGFLTTASMSGTKTVISSGARSFNTAYQVSSTNRAKIAVSAQLACALSISGGQSGTIVLETSANGTSGWTFEGVISGSNTGTLTIGLNTTQITGSQLIADLPAGYYWRLTTTNVTGTPTYTFNGGVQTVY